MTNADDIPVAYYAAGRSGWRAWWTLLHLPYTVMHLSFVVVGAALAPELNLRNLIATLLAFFLALGIAAHALDELAGRPLNTAISKGVLVAAATLGLLGAVALGIAGAIVSDPGILWFIPVGLFLVVSYNLELFGGLFHTHLWFGLAWGAFPVLTAHFAQTGEISGISVLGAAYGVAMSLTQRALSTPVRRLRRRVASVGGTINFKDGETQPIDRGLLLAPLERALRLLVVTSLVVAALLVALHFMRGSWVTGF